MSDRKTHQWVGAVSGAARIAHQSWGQPGCLMETIGGGFGGYWTSMLPDALEPAISSWHRSICHSLAAGGVVCSIDQLLSNWARYCREQADKVRAIQAIQDPLTLEFRPVVPMNLFQLLAEWFWSFLAGVLGGMTPGYLSHLVLDA